MENLVDYKSLFSGIYLNKRVLVTGHTGFKGSWLITWLELMGANVLGIALEPNTTPNHIELLNSKIQSKYININNFNELSKEVLAFSPEIIFHLAAQPLVKESYQNPLETFSTNIIGTANLLEIARNCESLKAIINVTTDKCYENLEQVYSYKETDPLGGYDPYSASKACSEIVTQSMRNSFFNIDEYKTKHNVLIATARAGNVIGGGDWCANRLIPDIIRSVSTNQTVEIRSPNSVRPWQHVLESLSAYLQLGWKLLDGNKAISGSWNIGPDDSMTLTVKNVLELSQKWWSDIKFEIIEQNDFHEAKLLMLDTNKAKEQLNWISVWDSSKAIEKTINWYKFYYLNNEVNTLEDLSNYIQDASLKNVDWI